jgi:hypothetical protein
MNYGRPGTGLDLREIGLKKGRMIQMKKLWRRFEVAMQAAAFAEEGEFETARQIVKEDRERETPRPRTTKRASERKVLRAE